MGTKKISLIEEIDGWGLTASSVLREMSDVKASDTVIIPINSYGGAVFEGMAIYNTIKGSKAKTESHILGYAMSMGTVIALAADEVVMPENGYFMIHEPSMITWGDSDTHDNAAALLNTMGMDAAKIYAEKTGKTPEEMRTLMKETTWLNAQEAFEMGFVDRLSEGTEINASAASLAGIPNLPTDLLNSESLTVSRESAKSTSKSLLSQIKSLLRMDTTEKTENTPVNEMTELKNDMAEMKETLKTIQESLSLSSTSTDDVEDENSEDPSVKMLQDKIAEMETKIKDLSKEPSADHTGGDAEDTGAQEEPAYMGLAINQENKKAGTEKATWLEGI